MLQQLDRVGQRLQTPPKGPPAALSVPELTARGSTARQRRLCVQGLPAQPITSAPVGWMLRRCRLLPVAQPSTPPAATELLPAQEPVRWLEQPEGHQRLAGSEAAGGAFWQAALSGRKLPRLLKADRDAASSGGSDSKKKKVRPRDYTVSRRAGGWLVSALSGLRRRKAHFDP